MKTCIVRIGAIAACLSAIVVSAIAPDTEKQKGLAILNAASARVGEQVKLAQALRKQGRIDAARAACERGIEVAGTGMRMDLAPRQLLAELDMDEQHWSDALVRLKTLFKEGSVDDEVPCLMAICEAKLGHPDDAKGVLEEPFKYLATNKDNFGFDDLPIAQSLTAESVIASADLILGLAHDSYPTPDKSVAYFAEAARLAPNNAATCFQYAWTLDMKEESFASYEPYYLAAYKTASDLLRSLIAYRLRIHGHRIE